MVTEARSPSLKAGNLNHVAVDSWVEHNPGGQAAHYVPFAVWQVRVHGQTGGAVPRGHAIQHGQAAETADPDSAAGGADEQRRGVRGAGWLAGVAEPSWSATARIPSASRHVWLRLPAHQLAAGRQTHVSGIGTEGISGRLSMETLQKWSALSLNRDALLRDGQRKVTFILAITQQYDPLTTHRERIN